MNEWMGGCCVVLGLYCTLWKAYERSDQEINFLYSLKTVKSVLVYLSFFTSQKNAMLKIVMGAAVPSANGNKKQQTNEK